MSESDLVITILAIIGGLALVAAADGQQSAKAHADSQSKIADLSVQLENTKQAVITGNTDLISKEPLKIATAADLGNPSRPSAP